MCTAGTQDNDHNGSCLPTCNTALLSCGSHSACSDASGTAKCGCTVGYIDAGGSCVWGSVPQDPGFRDTPVGAWTLASGATLSPTSLGLVDDGNAVFDRAAICTGNGSATQTVTMPTFALAEPMQLELSAQGNCTSSSFGCSMGNVNVSVNGSAISFPIPSNYANATKCLGERAFGVAAPMIVRHGSRSTPCSSTVSAYSVSVDHVQIKPNAACPTPRVVANADFEGTTNWSATGNGTSAITAGAGANSSQGWRISTTAASCVNSGMKGDYSLPFSDGASLALSLNGTAGKNLAFGETSGVTWGEYMAPSTTFATQTICVPQYAKGMVESLEFRTYNLTNTNACANGDARVFNLDNITLSTSSGCPADTSVVDPGFELSNGVVNYWALSLNLNGVAGSASAAIANGAATAHSGTHALVLTTQQGCTSATAQTVLSVPAPVSGAGPALKFFFNGGSANGSAQVTVGSTSITPSTQSAYTQQVLCLDPASAGEGVALTVRLLANGGSCATTFPVTTAYFDDFLVTTDASCPTR